MILSRIPHPTHTHHAPLTRRKSRFSSKILGTVTSYPNSMRSDTRIVFGVVREGAIVEGRCVVGGELGGFEMHVSVGERVLDCLVLAYRAGEDDALTGVVGGSGVVLVGGFGRVWQEGEVLFKSCVAETESFAGEETALCVHAMEDLGLISMRVLNLDIVKVERS
jgi:hypothetical protein